MKSKYCVRSVMYKTFFHLFSHHISKHLFNRSLSSQCAPLLSERDCVSFVINNYSQRS
jgi:hypothetical protein